MTDERCPKCNREHPENATNGFYCVVNQLAAAQAEVERLREENRMLKLELNAANE